MNLLDHAPAGAGHAATKFFQRRFPPAKSYNFYDKYLQAQLHDFGLWKGTTLAFVFLFLFGLPVLYALVLQKLYVSIYGLVLPADVWFLPATWMSFLPAGLFLMLMTITVPIEWIQKVALRDRYPVFAAYYDDQQGYDNAAAAKWLRKLMTVPFALVLTATAPQHMFLEEDGIRYQSFLAFKEELYPYSRVQTIQYIRGIQNKNGGIMEEHAYKILFNDGRKIYQGAYFTDYKAMLPLVHEVQNRTGLPIDSIPVLY